MLIFCYKVIKSAEEEKRRKVCLSELSLCDKPLQTCVKPEFKKNSLANNLGWVHLSTSVVSAEGSPASMVGCGLALLILAGLLCMFGDFSRHKVTG